MHTMCTACGLTEAVEYVERSDEQHRGDVDQPTELAQIEWTFGKIVTTAEDVCHEGDGVGGGRENNERTSQIQEGSRTPQGNGTKARSNDG